MRKRLDRGRREELLGGVMRIISERGFSDLRILDLAEELHCSASSLYRLAPNKKSIIALAIADWGERGLADMEEYARTGATASDRAQLYYSRAREYIRPLSQQFRLDMNKDELARISYDKIVSRFLARFNELLEDAVKAGEVRPINTRFMAQALRQIALFVWDEECMRACNLTPDEAMAEMDAMIWEGIRRKPPKPQKRS
jgi:AcrR family transcriptional regulator